MTKVVKVLIFMWLITCALLAWISIAIVGLFLSFSNWSFLYSALPFIGLTVVYCIIKCAVHVLPKRE